MAGDGFEAVRVFEMNGDRIDLVLLDVMMPGLSGREAMEQIHSLRAEVPVLFMSGYSEDAIHQDFVIEKGLHLLQKPYRRDELLRLVRQMIDSAPAPEKNG